MIKPIYKSPQPFRFVDLFCGIGGFRMAIESAASDLGIKTLCVFSSDIDQYARKTYQANFDGMPQGDITRINESEIPDHEILLAGFPCQPFSIIGERKGFEDARGTLFFDIQRILKKKKPKYFVLENVKMLVGHDKGKTIKIIMENLGALGYSAEFKVLNALDFGLPQKRERTWIVGRLDGARISWPQKKLQMIPLSKVLEKKVQKKWYASSYIREKRLKVLQENKSPTIWHENKSGHISAYPFSCALRAGASYNYLLVDGKRRLTTREMLRLQGFPDSFKIVCNDSQTRKQAGNSLPVAVAREIIKCLLVS